MPPAARVELECRVSDDLAVQFGDQRSMRFRRYPTSLTLCL
jgi:hypothetical protein